MMNPKLEEYMRSQAVPINPMIAESVVYHHMKQAPSYINAVMRTLSRGYPAGFTYEGMEFVTPIDEYNELVRPRDGESTYDLAQNNRIMMNFKFRFTQNGQSTDYSKMVSIPYVTRGGHIMLRGTKYQVTPVLSDRIISVDNSKEVFVRLIRDKLRFSREQYHYVANGMQETIQVVSSALYKHTANGKKSKPTICANTTLVFYMMCNFGMNEMFHRFTGIKPIVMIDGQYNPNDFPVHQYTICKSLGQKPHTYRAKTKWEKPVIHLIFRNEDYQLPAMKAFIAGVFYCLDHFTFEFQDVETLDDINKWRVMLGQALWSSEISWGRLLNDVSEHISELDMYVCDLMREKFLSTGLPVNDLYDLFYIIIRDMNQWLMERAGSLNDVYRKEITVLNFLLLDITAMFTRMYYSIKKAATSPKGLTHNAIDNAMKTLLKPHVALTSLASKHGELTPLSYSGDNMYFGFTMNITPQNKTYKASSKSSDRNVTKMPENFAHPSALEVTTGHSISKASPSGNTRISPYLNISPDGVIIRHQDLIEVIDIVTNEVRHN